MGTMQVLQCSKILRQPIGGTGRRLFATNHIQSQKLISLRNVQCSIPTPSKSTTASTKRCKTSKSLALSTSKQDLSSLLHTAAISTPSILTVLALSLATAPLALADEVGYNPGGGADTVKTIAGVGYIILVIIYFIRLFRRRAEKATSERIASTRDEEDDDDSDDEDVEVKEEEEATPLACFIGSIQAGFICYLLFLASTAVDGYFDKQVLPEQYTAHNIAVLVQTVVKGLAYLITFIFGANCAGLAGLGIQLLIFPDSLNEDGSRRGSDAPRLPKVSVTDDFGDIKRAFQAAEEMGRREALKKNKDSKNSSEKNK